MTFTARSGPPGGSDAGHKLLGISNVLSSLFSIHLSTNPSHSRCLEIDLRIFSELIRTDVA